MRLLILIVCILLSMVSAQAAIQIKVTAEENFSTESPSEFIDVKVNNDTSLGEHSLKAGDILKCEIIEIKSPKRGKQNANVYVRPVSYTSSGQTTEINEEYIGRYSKTVLSKEELKKVPKGKMVEKAAVTVGSAYIKGLGQGISLAEGMVKNEEGNRLKSGVKQVYKDSPLSYVEKGKALNIECGDEFYFVFKSDEPDRKNKPNYTYTEPEEKEN